MGIKDYSTTAGNNTSVGGVSTAENCPIANWNNAVRAAMADIREWYNDSQWVIYGDGDGSFTISYASATSVTVSGTDVTSVYHAGRRVKAVAATPGTIYGTISSSSFSANTTVNVTWDSGSLSNEAVTFYIGALSATNPSIPPAGININATTAVTALASGDKVLVYDASATANRAVTVQNFYNGINDALSALTAPDIADLLVLYDTSGTAATQITPVNFLKVINGLTEDTTPDTAADFALTYDTSASTVKKAKLRTFGAVLQQVRSEDGAVNTGTTQLPWDDTIPQNTEGDQYLSVSITPTSATSKLVIQIFSNFASGSGPSVISGALFQDSTAGALAATAVALPSANVSIPVTLVHTMTSGTTSSTTFKFRAGPSSAATITFNGASAARKFGGVSASMITVTEYAA